MTDMNMQAHIDVYEANVRAQFEQQILDLQAKIKTQEAQLISHESRSHDRGEKIQHLEQMILQEQSMRKATEEKWRRAEHAMNGTVGSPRLLEMLSEQETAAKKYKKLALDWKSKAVGVGVPRDERSRKAKQNHRRRVNRAMWRKAARSGASSTQ